MASGLREIRRKMKAIKATRQVTKAMELVAASKMRKAVQSAQQLRLYAQRAWSILERVAALNPDIHPTLHERPVKKVLAILFSSDRGLAGSLNAQLFRAVTQYVKTAQKAPTFQSLEFIAVGRKGQQYLARTNQTVIAAFPAFSNTPSFRDIAPAIRLAEQGFLRGEYDHVSLIFMDFISALIQEPAVKVLLPFSRSELKEMVAGLVLHKHGHPGEQEIPPAVQSGGEYLLEPSPQEVIDAIIPQLTQVQVYQGLLEAVASEHSARMVAMRSATDNATDIIDDLTLTYNQTRQANITAELAELSASKAALD
ncbi:MAG: ATP synthase F1 subunit gamma [Candidatus Peregrinibacteria bacterium]|nr:ATP synthase F1 subunit gamma [Candidatus Peregrinibacteria bacterium]